MSRPKLLDLFSGAGGAAKGYYDAGFDVTGIDIHYQKNYPYDFVQMDALDLMTSDNVQFVQETYDAVHASPPCQYYSYMSSCRPDLAAKYPDMIPPTRKFLQQVAMGDGGLPWVIENVPGAPLQHPVMLCGLMFDRELFRHRLFESNFPMPQPGHPKHTKPGGRAGHWKPGEVISVSGHFSPVWLGRQVMDIPAPWMTRDEIAEAIPPFMAKYVGQHLMTEIIEREFAA